MDADHVPSEITEILITDEQLQQRLAEVAAQVDEVCAVGRGDAVSHPKFYAYLCAVADWRLKKPRPSDVRRPGILVWSKFTEAHAKYWSVEDAWRKQVIEGNCDYYSTGILPAWLPLVTEMPSAIVSETTDGKRIEPRKAGKA